MRTTRDEVLVQAGDLFALELYASIGDAAAELALVDIDRLIRDDSTADLSESDVGFISFYVWRELKHAAPQGKRR